MKKLMMSVLIVMFACAVSYGAQGTKKGGEVIKSSREEIKLEKKELEELGKRYKQASESEKAGIEAQIKEVLEKSYDRRIARMERNLEEAKKEEVREKHISASAKKIMGIKGKKQRENKKPKSGNK